MVDDQDITWKIRFSLQDRCRANLLRYCEKALQSLPVLFNPKILDVGCGTGIPTKYLARTTSGEIWALDADPHAIEYLRETIQGEPFAGRVHPLCRKVGDDATWRADLPVFDVIWAEGILNVIGFENGAKWLLPCLGTPGHMVVHDEIKEKHKKMAFFKDLGLELLRHFEVPPSAWIDEYCKPLERLYLEHEAITRQHPEFTRDWKDIVEMQQNPATAHSIYYILEKK